MDVMDKELKVPKLRFKDDEGREFPQWEKRRLGEVALNISSGKSQKCEDGKYSLYGSTGIIGNSREADYLGSKLIIARVGACGFCRFVTEPCGISDNALVITSNDYNYNLQWLYYCVGIKHLERYAIGTAQPLITGSLLKRINLLFPTLSEQRKIADFLTAYDELIDNQKKRVEVLKLRKKGLLQKIFSQEIRFKDDEGREFPAWEERRLGDCAEINPLSVNLPKRFIYIDLESVKSGRLLSYKVLTKENAPSRAQRQVLNGDILFQMVRPYQNNHLLFNEISKLPVVASTGYSILRCNKNYSGYIYYAVQEKNFFRDMLNSCVGATYPAINVYSLSMLKILLPTLPEQRKIADFLSVADHQITLEEKRLDTMRLIKKALLQQLFV